MPLLSVTNLTKRYGVSAWPRQKLVTAVDGVSFQIERGETLGVVGESGCGKSTLARLILGLEPPTDGEILFKGKPYPRNLQHLRVQRGGALQAVLQDPTSSLNPKLRAGTLITEPLRVKDPTLSESLLQERAREAIELVGLPRDTMQRYPHEFSGGQRQRVAIARSIVAAPDLIVLDEPISSLDVSVAAQIMNLLKDLQQRLGISYLFIAHQLASVAYMSTNVAVMYLGRVVELGSARDIARRAAHPYTQALIGASLPPDLKIARAVKPLGGELPSPMHAPSGCHFHTRCPVARSECSDSVPPWAPISEGHLARCLHPLGSPQTHFMEAANPPLGQG